MPTRPVRFPQGLTTYSPRHVLATLPAAPTPFQVVATEDFIPYRASDYTLTTAVAGTVAAVNQVGGAVKMTTSASATDTMFLARGGTGFQFMQQNQLWCDTRLAYPRTVLNANDTNIYWGLFDTASPLTAANGVYFLKPAGGTAVNLIIKKAGVVTTFQNVGDVGLPSGLFGDTNSVNAILGATIAGGVFTAVTINTAGAGYEWAPLVLSTATAAGTVGTNVCSIMLGGTAYTSGNPQTPIQTSGLPYSSVVGPMLATSATGFTNAGPLTTLLEVEPLLNYHFVYDGKGGFFVGVNGRLVMSIIGTPSAVGVNGITAGGTTTVTASVNSFNSTVQLSVAASPFQPPIGSPMNLLPLVPLGYTIGFANTTANIRTLYVDEFNIATELT